MVTRNVWTPDQVRGDKIGCTLITDYSISRI